MTRIRAGSGFALLLAASQLCGPPARAATAQQNSKRTSAGSAVDAQPASVEVINGTSRVIKNFNAPQTTAASPERGNGSSTGTRVEVINGTAQRTVMFGSQPAKAADRQSSIRSKTVRYRHLKKDATAPAVATAEILNGTRRETRVFNGPADALVGSGLVRQGPHAVVIGIASSGSRTGNGATAPVVVGIASSNSHPEGGSAQPVVIRIASSGAESEAGTAQPVVVGIESSGLDGAVNQTQPVAIGIAPHAPKRPPYRRPQPNP
jgi:hypothetical protein